MKKVKPNIWKAINWLTVALFLNATVMFIMYFFPNFSTFVEPADNSVWTPRSIITDIPNNKLGKEIYYGYKLVTQTPVLIGPVATDKNMRYAGNNLTCNNCHLNAGRKIGSGSFIGVTKRFPQFRGRENKVGSMKDRINGCMERSMNGRALPESSREMNALIAYMTWLSENVPKEIEELYRGYAKFPVPKFMADTVMGKRYYQVKCMHCHMEDGRGKKRIENTFSGYIYPPIGGPDTYNDGSGMNRIITSARFIKSNMPYGATYDSPQLTDEEAFHIAAYINSFPRPIMKNKFKDFPDLKLKPVSTPYGPWADAFSPEQHKYGPFPEIIEFYKKEFNLIKTK